MGQEDNIPLFIMIGLLLQICLEYFSKGAEHGHFHIDNTKNTFPLLLFISLSLHALVEGMPISEENNLIIAIIVHKLPIAIILSLFLYESGYAMAKVIILISLFAAMTPLGLLLMNYVPYLSNFSFEITAIVIGVILHVSTVILFESSKNHTFNLAKFLTILGAFLLAYLL
jgi:zinc transporter ZupT